MNDDPEFFATFDRVMGDRCVFTLFDDNGKIREFKRHREHIPEGIAPGDYLRVEFEDTEIIDLAFDSEFHERLTERFPDGKPDRQTGPHPGHQQAASEHTERDS